MAAYRRVYDSRRLQADCQEPWSAPEPFARYRVWTTFTLFLNTKLHFTYFVYWSISDSGQVGCEIYYKICELCQWKQLQQED